MQETSLEYGVDKSTPIARIHIANSSAQRINAVIITKIDQLEVRVVKEDSNAAHTRKWWNLPVKISTLISRKELMPQLDQKLERSNGSPIACYGLPGVGKMHLLIDYVYKSLEKYDCIFWISAADNNQLKEEHVRLAGALGLIADDTVNPLEKLKDSLEKQEHGKCLLIYNKATSYETIEKYLPRKNVHILVSSRHSEWPIEGVAVSSFTQAQALKVFEDNPSDEVKQIIGYFECHPLALFQAKAYMNKNKLVTPKRYLELLIENPRRLLSNDTLPVNYHGKPVFNVFDEEFVHIKEKSILAYNLLLYFAKYDLSGVSSKVLKGVAETAEHNPKNEIYYEAKGLLCRFSIINDDGTTVTMNALIKKIIMFKIKSGCEFYKQNSSSPVDSNTAINAVEARLNQPSI